MIKTRSLLATSTAALALMAAAPAFAQDDIDDVIIVTATKRQTTLQDTPVAVTVTRAETIERAQIQDLIDLQSVVPSLRVSQLQASTQTDFVIRGFGNGANNPGIEPSVGVFVDGVYRSRSSAAIGDLPKLERVEVLAGPQSALFGKNASAGVISIVTQAPQFEKQGYIEAGIGNFDMYQAKAYFTAPISDTVAFSLGGNYQTRDGYFARTDSSLPRLNDRERYSLRGQLLFEPSDAMTIRLIGDMSSIDEKCCGTSTVRTSVTSNILQGLGYATNTGQVTNDPADPFARVFFGNKTPANTLDDFGFSGQIDYDFDNDMTLTSITAYRENESYSDIDADFTALNFLDGNIRNSELETFTQELRLTSNFDGRFNFQVGGFYFNEDVSNEESIAYGPLTRPYIDALTSAVGIPNVLATIEAFDPSVAPGSLFNDNVDIRESFTQKDETYSLFGTVDLELNDRFKVTGGMNYTKVAKNVTGSTVNNDIFSNLDLVNNPGLRAYATGAVIAQVPGFASFPAATQAAVLASLQPTIIGTHNAIAAGLFGFQFQPQFLPFPNAVEDGKVTDDKLTYSIRGNFALFDNVNVYAAYATGFKASSFNLSRDSRPFISDAAALQASNLLPNNYTPATSRNFGTRFAEPEDSAVFEVGAKAKFSRGTMNLSLFDQTLENFQANSFVGTSFVLSNAGETNVQGAEVNGRVDIFDSLKLDYAATYLDAEYIDFSDAPGPAGTPIDLSGTTPTNISELSASFGLTYEHEFQNGMSGFLRGDYQYESEARISNTLSPEGEAILQAGNALATRTFEYPGYADRGQNLVNVSAGLELENGLAIQLWGRNIFGDEYFTTLFPGVAQFGVVNAYPSQPATYGLNLRKNF
ncbi:TonB-dependent receptor [Algimonas arctica]|uniref:TonB-dependent receptor n=1 Tax=Algimonas arctica TaxID=1479486 RepID=A0A8J3CPV8_9PROT|nr:TonB-dependent receptor [Algimonas arctica]GHA82369.1 TonB-dependent receptor [Algimonas arctica]